MRNRISICAAVVAALMMTWPAMAQGVGEVTIQAIHQADVNHDGKVTFEEWKAIRPNCTQGRFNALDANHDGILGKEDVSTAATPKAPAATAPAAPAAKQIKAKGNAAEEQLQARRQEMLAKLKAADTNSDGKVTFEEAKTVFPKMTQERFTKLDKNGDGAISQEDRPEKGAAQGQHQAKALKNGAAASATPEQLQARRQEMLAKLKAADTNGDGKVTFEEAKTVFPKMTQEHFNKFDKNGDGVISQEDRPEKGVAQGRHQAKALKNDAANGQHQAKALKNGVAASATPEQRQARRQEMLARLKAADTNSDGKVTFEETKTAFPKMTQERFTKLDKNGDGAISQEDRPEKGAAQGRHQAKALKNDAANGQHQAKALKNGVAASATPEQRQARRQKILARLKAADTNGDGKITFEEAKTTFPKMTQERFNKLDKNGDGAITKEDRQSKS